MTPTCGYENGDGQTCDLDAGHKGMHEFTFTREWHSDNCVLPDDHEAHPCMDDDEATKAGL